MKVKEINKIINKKIDDVSRRIHDYELDFKTSRSQGFSDGCLSAIYEQISFEKGKAEAYREMYLLINN